MPGAKRVLVMHRQLLRLTVVYGVNDKKLLSHKLFPMRHAPQLPPGGASAEQNCGIARGYMTTQCTFTGDQRTVDTLHSDLRRARAASLSMIPASHGCGKPVGLVLPAGNWTAQPCECRHQCVND